MPTDVRVCIAEEQPGSDMSMGAASQKEHLILDYNCRFQLGQDRLFVTVFGFKANTIIIRFTRDNKTPLSLVDAKFQKVEIISGNNVLLTRSSLDSDIKLTDSLLYLPLSSTERVNNDELIEIRISIAGRTPLARYYRKRTQFSAYNAFENKIGVWFPIALFATNGRSTNAGLPIAAFPVGLAVGGQWHPSRAFYLGGSLMFNWVFQPVSAASTTTETSNTSNSINLASLSVGAIIDISNYAYAGTAYVFDLRNGQPNPGMSFVFGPAPGLLQLFQSRPANGN
jgi:hypothetical protein